MGSSIGTIRIKRLHWIVATHYLASDANAVRHELGRVSRYSSLENIAWSDVSRKSRGGEVEGNAEQASLLDHPI